MKKIILYLIFIPIAIGTLLILQGCKEIKEVKCTQISKFKINNINTEAIDADISLKIKNPNTTGFTIRKSEFDVTYSGIKIGKAKLMKNVKIKANTETEYVFKLQTVFKNVVSLDNVMAFMEGISRKGNVEVKGDLKISKGLVKKKFPINYSEKLNVEN